MKYLPGLHGLGALLLAGCVSSSGGVVNGSGGGSTSVTTSGAGGGGDTCPGTQLGSAEIKLAINGSNVSEPTAQPYETTVEGKVLSSGPGIVTIDTCPPGDACTGVPAKLEVTAPNLPSLLVPPDALVRLRFRVETTFGAVLNSGTQHVVLIENLADWMGSPNPISSTSRIWFAAFSSNGPLAVTPVDLPFTVQEGSCGPCYSPPDGGGSLGITFPGLEAVGVQTGAQLAFDVMGERAAHYVFQALYVWRDCEGNGGSSYWLTGS